MRQRIGSFVAQVLLCALSPVAFSFQHNYPKGISRKQVLSTVPWILLAPPSIVSASIPPCSPSSNSCLSTASVRALDKFIAPWSYPSNLSSSDVIDRLANSLTQCEILERSDTSLKAKSTRNFGAVDEISFEVNDADRVIAITSQQVDGPELNGLAGQKNRLREIQLKAGFLGGEEVPREGALGQLKAFYGLQSGSGFEDVFLEE
ncbi:hypothetical protein FisN_23Lu212 [Fistulifera solaris]|uniref:Uncharacterized protein n=1 Tax=Fistulifera solaris TaxID=1519565 RepID=A0A1Z5JS31_FISSO|nr:hypothetical protein FisN_23Lu212 [Fistulifera solaris]|eukprot:GAX16662.1 hypothetical protein FisN_23Lu212 [Fistulifera solaris]